MKKFFAWLILAVALCLALVGCATSPEQPPADGEGGGTGVTDVVPEKPVESETPEPTGTDNEEVTKMYITVNGKKAEMTLVKNSTTDALVQKLKNGDITYSADDYGGFEKVGSSLDLDLPTSDERITTKTGDVVLYSGNKIVIFYGSNTWEYTRLGRIEGTVAELKEFLAVGTNGVTVTLSLTK